MTKALDAAVRAAHMEMNAGNINICFGGEVCHRLPCVCAEGIARAALPAEPPEWWQDWWDHFGFEEVGYSYRSPGYRALRAHLLGEDA